MPLLNNMKKLSEGWGKKIKESEAAIGGVRLVELRGEVVAFESQQAAIQVGRLDQKGTG